MRIARHSRESGNPPVRIVVSKTKRTGRSMQLGHLSPYPNTNAHQALIRCCAPAASSASAVFTSSRCSARCTLR